MTNIRCVRRIQDTGTHFHNQFTNSVTQCQHPELPTGPLINRTPQLLVRTAVAYIQNFLTKPKVRKEKGNARNIEPEALCTQVRPPGPHFETFYTFVFDSCILRWYLCATGRK